MAGVALAVILGAVTMLLCYAGYIFLIVDRRQASQELEDPETFAELDDKNYDFYLPEEADTYEELRISEPADKCASRRARPPPHQAPPGLAGRRRLLAQMLRARHAARPLRRAAPAPRGPPRAAHPRVRAARSPSHRRHLSAPAGARCRWRCSTARRPTSR